MASALIALALHMQQQETASQALSTVVPGVDALIGRWLDTSLGVSAPDRLLKIQRSMFRNEIYIYDQFGRGGDSGILYPEATLRGNTIRWEGSCGVYSDGRIFWLSGQVWLKVSIVEFPQPLTPP